MLRNMKNELFECMVRHDVTVDILCGKIGVTRTRLLDIIDEKVKPTAAEVRLIGYFFGKAYSYLFETDEDLS